MLSYKKGAVFFFICTICYVTNSAISATWKSLLFRQHLTFIKHLRKRFLGYLNRQTFQKEIWLCKISWLLIWPYELLKPPTMLYFFFIIIFLYIYRSIINGKKNKTRLLLRFHYTIFSRNTRLYIILKMSNNSPYPSGLCNVNTFLLWALFIPLLFSIQCTYVIFQTISTETNSLWRRPCTESNTYCTLLIEDL